MTSRPLMGNTHKIVACLCATFSEAEYLMGLIFTLLLYLSLFRCIPSIWRWEWQNPFPNLYRTWHILTSFHYWERSSESSIPLFRATVARPRPNQTPPLCAESKMAGLQRSWDQSRGALPGHRLGWRAPNLAEGGATTSWEVATGRGDPYHVLMW